MEKNGFYLTSLEMWNYIPLDIRRESLCFDLNRNEFKDPLHYYRHWSRLRRVCKEWKEWADLKVKWRWITSKRPETAKSKGVNWALKRAILKKSPESLAFILKVNNPLIDPYFEGQFPFNTLISAFVFYKEKEFKSEREKVKSMIEILIRHSQCHLSWGIHLGPLLANSEKEMLFKIIKDPHFELSGTTLNQWRIDYKMDEIFVDQVKKIIEEKSSK